MKIRIQAAVQEDLLEGCSFYERQEKGLGSYFIDSIFSDIDSLQLYAGIHPVHWGFHRMLSLRFPYAIYYRVDDSEVKVYAVVNCMRNPLKTSRKLKEGVSSSRAKKRRLPLLH